MTKRKTQDEVPSLGNPGAGDEASKVGPTGLTYREKQRRRLVIAGLAAPTLMSLPSRRAWSMACSKSKLKKMSGNLSAKKKSATTCDPIACGDGFWKNTGSWPVGTFSMDPDPTPGDDFESKFSAGVLSGPAYPMYESPVTLSMVLNGGGTIRKKNTGGADSFWKGKESEAKDLNKAAVTAYLNAHFLNNMRFIIGYVIAGETDLMDPSATSSSRVVSIYGDYLTSAILIGSKDPLKNGKNDFRMYNEGQVCPL